MQNTFGRDILIDGIGLHSGQAVRMVLRPAPAGTGIVFDRMDRPAGLRRVPALWSLAVQSPLATRIVAPNGAEVSTIEHLMAAFAGTGIHNAVVELDGPEVPILDGSSLPFVRAILAAGIVRQAADLHAVKVLRPVEVRDGAAWARLSPATTLQIHFAIHFADGAIGRQDIGLNMANGTFLRDLCDARTFCRQADVEAMRAQGLALGGTLDNAVVVDGDRVLTPGGLRRADEAVRHKALDALGDLYTAGAPILGRYDGVRAGHAMTNRLLRALFADPTAWRRVRVTPAMAGRLPGAGVSPSDLRSVA